MRKGLRNSLLAFVLVFCTCAATDPTIQFTDPDYTATKESCSVQIGPKTGKLLLDCTCSEFWGTLGSTTASAADFLAWVQLYQNFCGPVEWLPNAGKLD